MSFYYSDDNINVLMVDRARRSSDILCRADEENHSWPNLSNNVPRKVMEHCPLLLVVLNQYEFTYGL
jgi:hypothetical protein